MIALRPMTRKIGGASVKIFEGKTIPKIVLDSYSKEEITELKDKKMIANDPEKKKEPKK